MSYWKFGTMSDFYEYVYKYMKSIGKPYVYFWIILMTVFTTNLTVSSFIDGFRQDKHFKLPLHLITDHIETNKYARSVDQNWPRRGENQIFFVESSCTVSTKGYDTSEPAVILSNIQACAIESAATYNPDAVVYLFYTCPLDSASLNRSSDIVQSLFGRPNVNIWHESMESFFEGTPLEDFHSANTLRWSFYPKLHASEVLRTLILWKYGGTYLDLDVVTRRPFSDLASDFVSLRERGVLSYAAARLSGSGVGRTIADKFVRSMRDDFQGHLAKYNGPDMIARVLKEHCKEENVEMFTKEKCGNLSVLPRQVFNPNEWNKEAERDFVNLVEDGEQQLFRPHAMHLSAYFRKGYMPRPGSKQEVEDVMKAYCPEVYARRNMTA